MILGIIFVSFSTRGHQWVFSYPKVSDNGTFLGFDHEFLADVLSPKVALCDKKFQLRIDNIDFIGHPTLLNVDRPGAGLIYSRKIQKRLLQNSKTSPLTMFHLVFAMSSAKQDELDCIYENCLLKVTAGLKYEQLKRSYVRNETETILHQREIAGEDEVITKSSLAQTLIHVYNIVKEEIPTAITINNSIRISIHSNLKRLKELGQSLDQINRNYPIIRPYHTLLLLREPDEILLSIPKDSSPLLIAMIEAITPTITFEQLQTTLGCSLAQLYKFASHLHYWGVARIIQAINSRNFYTISTNADFSKLGSITAELNRRYPVIDPLQFIQDLGIPRPLQHFIKVKEHKPAYFQSIALLLTWDFLAQIDIYPILIVPGTIYEKVTKTVPKQIVIQDPKNAAGMEKQCISQMIASQHNPIIRGLFTRIIPYLNGKNTLDEIAFQENLSRLRMLTRKEIKSVTSSFKDEIAIILRE